MEQYNTPQTDSWCDLKQFLTSGSTAPLSQAYGGIHECVSCAPMHQRIEKGVSTIIVTRVTEREYTMTAATAIIPE